ncbi:MAG: polysaccharide deacetylase family protein [Clostridia bacterium]|nr:polysaccharide deacetylase family protein [Clostridia bacterium]MBQ8427567.1 polysaccharide deacetylase family protein [Clostridia bacterium]
MKKLEKKITILSNIALFCAFIFVFSVCFIPTKTSAVLGGNGTVTAIYNGNRKNPNVSLMFNVYENTKVVEDILVVLKENNVKATFFVGGCWADDNGDTLNKIIADGNEIANHGYFHKDHKKLSYDKNYEEISLTGVIVKALCGVQPTLFAPPSGSFSENTLRAADSLGYKVIMWSKDTIDWRDKDIDLVYKRATKNVTNGDLILMHPKEHTLLALPRILEYYNSIGLKVVTVSENLK